MQNYKDFFSLIFYSDDIPIINGITFTTREIDIISCVVNMRGASRIAGLLSISPRTVHTHIRNILLKLGCNSREGIIDFIEKSDHMDLIKERYTHIRIHQIFVEALRGIEKEKNHPQLNLLVLFYETQDERIFLLNHLSKYLKLAGIKPEIKEGAIESINSRPPNPNHVPFCVVKTMKEEHIKSSSFSWVRVSDQANYYLCVFEILKLIFPERNFQEISMDFQKKPKSILKADNSASSINFNETASDTNEPISTFKKTPKEIFFVVAFAFFCFGLSAFWILNHSELIPSFDKTIVMLKSNQLENSYHFPHVHKVEAWNTPRQDLKFIGREELLKTLHNKLLTPSDFHHRAGSIRKSVICVFTGLGGIGKTQLALQYLHHSNHPYVLRAWFPAENTDQLNQLYIEFAKTLGYVDEKLNAKEAISYVKAWFEKHPGWLLVYDNVKTYEELAPFLPDKGGHIILTTRQRHWPHTFKILPIDVMTEKESLALLQTLTQFNIQHIEMQEAKKLVKSLGYLPLALAQAGTYIYQNKIKIQEYLNLYNKYEKKLLLDTIMPGGINSRPIATTWQISLDAIANETKDQDEFLLVRELLTTCSYLASEKISRQMLLSWLTTAHPHLSSPQLTLNKILRLLWRYSIIDYDGENFVSVHRLVQAVLRQQHSIPPKANNNFIPLTSKWYTNLLEAMNLEFKKALSPLENETRQELLLPHLQKLIEYCDLQDWKDKRVFIALSRVLENVGSVFHNHMRDPRGAKPYYERALAIKETYYGDNHIEVAKTLTIFGDAYGTLGNPEKQKEFLEHALRINESYYGDSHSSLVLTLESLGAAYWALGNPKRSKEILERGLKLGETHYGNKSIKIVKTLYYLGNVCGDLGELEHQKDILERALQIYETHYGKEHVQTSFVLENLGIAYRRLGDLKKSVKFLESALLIQEKYYGNNHVEVGETLGNLSNTYLALGAAKKAKKTLDRAISILESYYGKDHVYVARTLSYLGDVYVVTGKSQKALEVLERTLKIKERYYGNDHFSTASTLVSLGNAFISVGDLKKATAVLQRALKIQMRHYGKNHPEVMNTLFSLKKANENL